MMRKPLNPQTAITTSSIQILLQYAAKQGVNLQDALVGSRLTEAQCQQSSDTIQAWQEIQVVRNLINHISNRYGADFGQGIGFGLEVGSNYHIAGYGMWGLAMMTSARVVDAVKLGTRYLPIASRFTKISVDDTEEQAILCLHNHHIPEDIRPFYMGRDLASIVVILQSLLSEHDLSSLTVHLAYPEPDYPQRLTQLFSGRLQWGCNRHQITGPIGIRDRTLPKANPLTVALCEKQCLKQLKLLDARTSIKGKVEHLLLRELDKSPSMHKIATDLNTTVRTLRRQLENEGTNWRDMMLGLRMQQAERLLSESMLSIQQIADQLGYSDASAFSHAFKRAKHASPEQYRRQSEHLNGMLLSEHQHA
ncbi:MAG: AraC family transcriptional regulator ligand-binding domain-containing protein [Hahellaceae bacterium]|nr:AraC family transcriptional regulator ligand-binding domain-containing protein [Hahellaceae bacterium]